MKKSKLNTIEFPLGKVQVTFETEVLPDDTVQLTVEVWPKPYDQLFKENGVCGSEPFKSNTDEGRAKEIAEIKAKRASLMQSKVVMKIYPNAGNQLVEELQKALNKVREIDQAKKNLNNLRLKNN